MIGIFDSGYGGLTILNHIRQHLPQYEYLYLGDNARAPYGTRSFDVIYEYTLQAVNYLHQQGCNLIILACNTASAKALRTIQQHDINPDELRVLGVIRPTVEVIPQRTRTKHIGVLATPGTVASESYVIELLTRDPLIDSIILGCTHYPLLQPKIEAFLKTTPNIVINTPHHLSTLQGGVGGGLISQGEIVAHSLADYLHRHPEIVERISSPLRGRSGGGFLTTESATKFAESASLFLSEPITAQHIELQ